MIDQQSITVMGRIVNDRPGRFYDVELENGYVILAYMAGKLIKHKIRLIVGDRVEVEIPTVDLTRGRIVYRHRD